MAKVFEELSLPRKKYSSAMGGYRIYKSASDYVVVPANTVQEALETSGIKDAIKVERELIDAFTVMDSKTLMEVEVNVDVESPSAVQPSPPATVEVPANS